MKVDYRDGITERGLELIANLDETLQDANSPQEVAMALAGPIRELFDADYCRFWWRTDDPGEVRVIAHHPHIEFKEEWEYIKRLDDDRNSVVKSIFVVGDLRIEKDTSLLKDAEQRYVTVYKALSGVHVPVRVNGEVMGDMAMVSQRETHHFHEEQVPLLHALANVAGRAISLAQLRSTVA